MKPHYALKRKVLPYLYLLPSSIIMLVMLSYPIVYDFGVSFCKWTLMSSQKTFNGLDNYIKILKDSKFLTIVSTTVIWTVVGVVLQMLLGIALALFVDRMRRGRQALRTVLLIPWVIPGVVTALIWKWMLQADIGIVNYVLMQLHLTGKSILFLSDSHIALFTLILVNVWKATPFWFLMMTARLQNKPTDQMEAAIIDGAGSYQVFRYVLLPHLSPTIASTGVLTTIWTLNYFDLIWVVTKGGPADATSTLPVYTYRLAFEFNDFGRSAAMAVISFLLVSIVCIPYIKKMFQNLKEEDAL